MSDPEIEATKAYIQQAGPNGTSLFDHLSELVLQLVETRPKDALERFEEISQELKLSASKPIESETTHSGEKISPNILEKIRTEGLKAAVSLVKPESQSEEQAPTEVRFPDTFDEGYYFNKLGVGISEEELTQISLHMKSHFSKLPLKSARFFGKIYGLEKDYYIVEGEPVGELEEEEEAGATPEESGENTEGGKDTSEEGATKEDEEGEEEAPGEPQIEPDPDEPQTPRAKPIPEPEEIPKEERREFTPNQYVYWVCHGPADPWRRLPDVTPKLIKAARLVRKQFTGNLNARVSEGYPVFPGKERQYLRAQLARISHSTAVTPKMFVPKNEGAEEAEEEGGANGPGPNATVDVATLADESAWLHARPPLLIQGRVERWPPREGAEEEGSEESPAKAAVKAARATLLAGEVWEGEEDPKSGINLRPVKALNEDKKLNSGAVGSFTFRQDPLTGNGAVLLRSTYWPGSYTLAYGGKKAVVTSLYIGFGQKYSGLAHTMPPPPPIPDEYPDLNELADPTVAEEAAVKAAVGGPAAANARTAEGGEEEGEGEEGAEEES